MRPAWLLAVLGAVLAAPAAAQNLPSLANQPPGPNYLSPGLVPDLAFGAYQRGYYKTAMAEALHRLELNSGDVAAMLLVGELYKEGLADKLDPAEAVKWFRKAADLGDPEGAFSLAIAYLAGEGVEESEQKALPLLKAAAAKGHPAALYQLGLQYMTGDAQDPAKALGLFQRAMDAGDIDAIYALGLMYKEGRGVEKDLAKAASLLRRAANLRLSAAEVDYAIILFRGEGVEADEEGAARYFLLAASANNPVAMNRLAHLYVEGRGVKADIVEAMKWHILARSAGERDEWLDNQLNRLSPRERVAVEEAIRKQLSN